MSQIYNSSNASTPPSVATSYTTDNGTAVPAANILDVRGIEQITNNDNGITVVGGLAQAGAANRVQVQLTNRTTGAGTTNNTTTTLNLISFNLGTTPGVYYFEGNIIGYDKTHAAGNANGFNFAAKTNGTATGGVEIGSTLTSDYEDASFAFVSLNVQILPNTNTLLVTVVGDGVATVDWNAVLTYRFVS